MGKKKKNWDDSRYKIEEILDVIGEPKNNWGKFILKATMDDGPEMIDIRNLGKKEDGSYTIGKGISLRNDEADQVTDSLLKHGFGDMLNLTKEYKKRKNTFYPSDYTEDDVINDLENRA